MQEPMLLSSYLRKIYDKKHDLLVMTLIINVLSPQSLKYLKTHSYEEILSFHRTFKQIIDSLINRKEKKYTIMEVFEGFVIYEDYPHYNPLMKIVYRDDSVLSFKCYLPKTKNKEILSEDKYLYIDEDQNVMNLWRVMNI